MYEIITKLGVERRTMRVVGNKNEHTLLYRKLDNEDKYLYKCQMEIVTSLRTNIFHCIAENS